MRRAVDCGLRNARGRRRWGAGVGIPTKGTIEADHGGAAGRREREEGLGWKLRLKWEVEDWS